MHTRTSRIFRVASLLIAIAGAWSSTALAIADGQWTRLPVPTAGHLRSVVRDEQGNRLISFGGTNGSSYSNEVFVLPLSGPPEWQLLQTVGTPPAPRSGQAAVYDPVRHRLLVFGGTTISGQVGDAWALSLSGTPTWSQLFPTSGPSPRYGHAAIYDPVRDRVVVFGGNTGSAKLNDVWVLPLTTFPLGWSQLAPAGDTPTTRWGSTGIYDPVDDRMIVFGGVQLATGFNDVWALSLGGAPVWTPLAPTGTLPGGRWTHAAAYDPLRGRLLVFGGYNGTTYLNDVWALTLGASPAWAPVAAGGTPPAARWGTTWINDPVLDRMVLFGGGAVAGETNDLWSLPLGAPQWQEVFGTSGNAPWRYDHGAVFDPVSRRMFVIDGFNGSFLNDVWAASVDDPTFWAPVLPLGPAPPARTNFSATLDGARRRIIVIGGVGSGTGVRFNDVWALSLDPPIQWTQLSPGGTPPSPIDTHVAILDPIRNRIIVQGGVTVSDGNTNRVWALSLLGDGTWSELSPVGGPPAVRTAHAGIYDPIRDRLVIAGGYNGGFHVLNDVWALTLSGTPTWHQLVNVFSFSSQTAVYDAGNDRMLLFGGYNSDATNDTWAVPLGPSGLTTLLAPSGARPSPRFSHSAVYDAEGAQMIVFGGFNVPSPNGDVWSLKLPVNTTAVPPATTRSGVQLAAAVPDPAVGEVTIGFTLASDGEATLNVYDVGGRLMRSLVDASLPAGPQTVRWDRRDSAGNVVPAGLYFYELRVGQIRMARRVVLVH